MIVDRHPLMRAAVGGALRTGGLEVVSAVPSAEAALEALAQLRPDVMLVSLELPGISGMELLRMLPAWSAATRVVILGDHPSEADAIEAMSFGAWGYLTKEIAPDALVRAVRGVHEGHLAMSRPAAAAAMRRLAALVGHAATRLQGATLETLTERELEVISLLADGMVDREIADRLSLSPRTVEKHVGNILHKLGCRGRNEAAARYRSSVAAPSAPV